MSHSTRRWGDGPTGLEGAGVALGCVHADVIKVLPVLDTVPAPGARAVPLCRRCGGFLVRGTWIELGELLYPLGAGLMPLGAAS